jgi:predicted extracellular nuclease
MKQLLVIAGIIGGALALGGSARAVSPNLVISEVYGGGGNTGAAYTHDYIELRNAGSAPASLAGLSVQYAIAAGSSWSVTALPSLMLGPGQYFLIQEASGGPAGSPLPPPDATGSIALAATAGKVALVAGTAALSGSCPSGAVDLVGYGAANCFEGAAPAPAPSNTLAARRIRADSDQNGADFEALLADPQNTGSPTAVTLRSFTATRSGGTVVLRWRTSSEAGTLGFDVYRTLAGARVKLNRRLIMAAGGLGGHAYAFRVSRAARGGTYSLEEVRTDGTRAWIASIRR